MFCVLGKKMENGDWTSYSVRVLDGGDGTRSFLRMRGAAAQESGDV